MNFIIVIRMPNEDEFKIFNEQFAKKNFHIKIRRMLHNSILVWRRPLHSPQLHCMDICFQEFTKICAKIKIWPQNYKIIKEKIAKKLTHFHCV